MQMTANPDLPDVYSAREIARAAGVRPRDVRTWSTAGLIQPVADRFFTAGGCRFRGPFALGVRTAGDARSSDRRPAFAASRAAARARRARCTPAMLAGLVLMTTMGMARAGGGRRQPDRKEMRLVFLVAPGPGGGGGGGGHQRARAPTAGRTQRRRKAAEPDPGPAAAAPGRASAGRPRPIRRR